MINKYALVFNTNYNLYHTVLISPCEDAIY